MTNEQTVEYIEKSFLSSLLKDPEITDISYNGQFIYYMHNNFGRKKANIIVDLSTVKDFLRQIANTTERQFSYQTPYLDVSLGKYRINAVHQSIGRKHNKEALTFSIRIGSNKNHISNDGEFMPVQVHKLLEIVIKSKISIVLGGLTGTGKTELQKYIFNMMEPSTRIIIIDNILELSNIENDQELDVSIWQVDEKNKESNTQQLVKNALRSNPDWLVVAESRGNEMIEVLNSAMTGHPIITTLHALSASSIPNRMGRMVMMNDKKMDLENVMADIYYHFRLFIYLKRIITKDGTVKRFVSEIVQIQEDGTMCEIYKKGPVIDKYRPLSKSFLDMLPSSLQKELPKEFVK